MSSPSNPFECRWHVSGRVLVFYLAAQLAAIAGLCLAAIPLWATVVGLALCAGHAGWTFGAPRFSGIRHDAAGWKLWRAPDGWQAVQLKPDSLALPSLIVLRFRLPGQWRVRGLCIARDALPADDHRRLRVRLKFTRRRWAAPE